MNIIQNYIPTGSKRRSGQKLISMLFIVCHDTGNDGTSAKANVDYFIASAKDEEASAHAFVDDQGVIECIPETEKAWHVRRNMTTDNIMFGVDSNDYALGIELCFFSKDPERSKIAYNNYVNYIRGLCTKYNLNPAKRLVAHKTLDPDRRTDPITAFSKINKTWEDFINDVSQVTTTTPKEIILRRLDELTQLVKELPNETK